MTKSYLSKYYMLQMSTDYLFSKSCDYLHFWERDTSQNQNNNNKTCIPANDLMLALFQFWQLFHPSNMAKTKKQAWECIWPIKLLVSLFKYKVSEQKSKKKLGWIPKTACLISNELSCLVLMIKTWQLEYFDAILWRFPKELSAANIPGMFI